MQLMQQVKIVVVTAVTAALLWRQLGVVLEGLLTNCEASYHGPSHDPTLLLL